MIERRDTSLAIYVGDCIEVMRTLGDDSVDSIVTDPPYGISFMAKGWDSFAGNVQYAAWVETWSRECLRVLRPGGHLLAFGGTRTYHALAWGVESAGFEIRDMLEFLYVSGFPHTTDVGSKFAQRGNPELASQYAGYHSGIKPAHEPIVMARKPFTGTLVDNVQRYGTGAVNVDACRIPLGVDEGVPVGSGTRQGTGNVYRMSGATMQNGGNVTPESGRFPANCVTVEDDEWYSRYFGITNIRHRTISRKAS
jgi:site-specific DNA-methyltransferase (adenine-specific)